MASNIFVPKHYSSLLPDRASPGSPGLASQHLMKMSWAGGRQALGQVLAQGMGRCLNPNHLSYEHSENTPCQAASDLTGLGQVAMQWEAMQWDCAGEPVTNWSWNFSSQGRTSIQFIKRTRER